MTKNDGIGNGSIPLRIGRLIDTTVYGGPYREVPELFWGVKMAEEIDHPHMVDIPTKDYSVPEVSVLKAGIVRALMAMINEENVYAGCWGGIGRTGIFLAALAKVQIEYRKSKHRAGRGEDPVLYVRKHFIPHAVETEEQKQYIADLDVSDIVNWLTTTQTAMGMGGLTPAREAIVTAEQTPDGEFHGRSKIISPTGRIVRDPEFQNIKPGWIADADKIGDPAFDRYGADWKERQNAASMSVISQRGLSQEGRIDDQQITIDELELQVESQQHVLKILNDRISNQSQLLRILEIRLDRTLTKPTIREKIRTWLDTH